MIDQRLESVIKYRCIQVEDIPSGGSVDYHKVLESWDTEDEKAARLIDDIVQDSFPPQSDWK